MSPFLCATDVMSEAPQTPAERRPSLEGRTSDRFEQRHRVGHADPEEWPSADGVKRSILYVTPSELRQLVEELQRLLSRHDERLVDPGLRPPGARLVEVLAGAYPVRFGRVRDDRPEGA
jgi:hypothetical protein